MKFWVMSLRRNKERSLVVVIRIWTVVVLLISLLVMVTAKGNKIYGQQLNFTFVSSLIYVMSTAVIGLVYSLVQTVVCFHCLDPANASSVVYMFVFSADLGMAFLLMSAGSAGGAVMMQMRKDYSQAYDDDFLGFYRFHTFASTSIAFEFFGFAFVAFCSVLFAKKTFQFLPPLPSHTSYAHGHVSDVVVSIPQENHASIP